MIPKIVHYVWVGGNKKPRQVRGCIKTWKKHLKGYRFIEWNESNFDMHQNKSLEEAYKAKKWAFVSDYIRAKVIYEYGGIYFDTDNIILENLDSLLNDKAFVGFENPKYAFTAVFGAEAHHPFLKDMLSYYDKNNFSYDKNNQFVGINTSWVSDLLEEKYGVLLNNKEQHLKTGIHVYPDNILCVPSSKSKAIHIFAGSWLEGKNLKRKIFTTLKGKIRTQKEAELFIKIFGHG